MTNPFKTVFRNTVIAAVAIVAIGLTAAAPAAQAAERTSFKLAWSIYVGWMPWGWAADTGIVDKWADRYGIDIEVVQFNDYIESINQYTAGAFDGVTATQMDALGIPSVGGVDTTALLIGDFSNGNDALILKDGDAVEDVIGRNVNLVELSVSHYLLARALETIGKAERDVTVVNTSDADMIAAYQTDDVTAVVTWNPLVAEILSMPNATKVFDSSDIPGEIIDLTVVNSETLADNPALGKALAGAWYETMSIMMSDTEEGRAARAAMGKASGTDLAGYDMQLASTKMFFDPAEAAAFGASADLKTTMDSVRTFLFDHGLLGDGAPSADVVGIEFADGTVMGDAANVKLRFTTRYMDMAADGDL
ncbi:putative urea ABC transporter substrate-binding protein [Roseospira goensis]|uniref:NitT/TauT family transport system substrate-binding protein n=1 Tax=Roseospira goensis TaxID=391922 RepID=A0A7W6WKL5_9PROT|nr:putative urea ABC transporter substrate-binding protein [Roseospira goensis]MBB4285884.1 NitT/TauT family transport system substrate-binding protein [Roseospira goensis]